MRTTIFITLIAFTVITACDTNRNKPAKSEYATSIDNLIEQSQNFDADDIAQYLPGKWEEHSIIVYDDNWETIEYIPKYKGDWNGYYGGSNGGYMFTAGGEGTYSFTIEAPPGEEMVFAFDWQYDEANRKLILSGRWNYQFYVSGFNDKYIVVDFYDATNKHNERNILKKVE